MNIDIFESRVEKIPFSGCWIWMKDIRANYGSMWFQGRTEFAHRCAYQLYKGPIPDGLDVLHTCDVKPCVNPNHLYAGTDSQNAQDYLARRPPGTVRAARGPSKNPNARCAYGHLFDADNTMWRNDGRRSCRTCNIDRKIAWKLGLTLNIFYDRVQTIKEHPEWLAQ